MRQEADRRRRAGADGFGSVDVRETISAITALYERGGVQRPELRLLWLESETTGTDDATLNALVANPEAGAPAWRTRSRDAHRAARTLRPNDLALRATPVVATVPPEPGRLVLFWLFITNPTSVPVGAPGAPGNACVTWSWRPSDSSPPPTSIGAGLQALPRDGIAPHQSRHVICFAVAPRKAGRYTLHVALHAVGRVLAEAHRAPVAIGIGS